MDPLERRMADAGRGLLLINLVDFDTRYGHRSDVDGYSRNLDRFDRRLAPLVPRLRDDDLLVVTADQVDDPTTSGTDHPREYVPLLVTGRLVRAGVDWERARRSPILDRRLRTSSVSGRWPTERAFFVTSRRRTQRSRNRGVLSLWVPCADQRITPSHAHDP